MALNPDESTHLCEEKKKYRTVKIKSRNYIGLGKYQHERCHAGYIKYSEFLAAAVQEQNFLEDDRVVDAFNKLDTDHNGTISREDLKGILGDELDDAAIDRMIAEADFHQDGVISLDEFRMMLEGKKARPAT